MDQKRIAMLVANANKEPFISINSTNFRKPHVVLTDWIIDVYYYEGRQSGLLEEKVRERIELIRYKWFWPVLKIYDSTFLNLRWKSIPIAQHILEEEGPSRLISQSPEDLRHLAVKFYSSLQFCIEKDYDFVLRTTSNSLFNIDNLLATLIQHDPCKFLYMGRRLELPGKSPIISGSFLLLNRIAMKILKDNIPKHDHSVLDDVAIGKILGYEATRLEPHFAKSIDLDCEKAVEDLQLDEFQQFTHYRCKSRDIPRIDHIIVKKLISRLDKAAIDYI